MGKRDIRNAVDQWIDAWNAHDMKGIESSYTEDAVLFQTPTRTKFSGRNYIMDRQRDGLRMSSDMQVYLRELYIDGDTAILEITDAGTNDGPFLDYPPTGKKFELDTCLIFKFRDGKISEQIDYLDTATVLRAFGLLKIPGTRPEVA